MTQAAVEERPAIQPDTEVPAAVETEALRGTDDEDSGAQTGDEARSTGGDTPAPDGRAARLTALKEAEREEERQRGREEALQEIQQGSTKTQREQNRARLKQSFPSAQAAIDRIVAAAKDDYGNPRALTEAEHTGIKNALAGHNLVAWESAEAEISDIVRDAVYAKLDKAGQETLSKLADGADKMPLPQYLEHYAELAALHTKAIKNLDLDAAIAASPKIKKQLAARDVEQYDAGYEAGLTAPPGTSPDGGRAGQRSAPGRMSFIELEKGYGDGTNTKEQDAEYRKQLAARAKAR